VAVRGQWQTPRWLDSASALKIGDKDLVPGALIGKGTEITIRKSGPLPTGSDAAENPPDWPDELEVQVLSGPEFQTFSAEQIAFFFNTTFTLRSDSNRIGYRLDPLLPGYSPKTELISSGTVPGTIQVARDGQPIILMADAQTTGGYPRIAIVLSADLDRLAQLKPGDTMTFRIVKGGQKPLPLGFK